jgi:hypothetical protein
MIEATVFIGAMIIAATQFVKYLVPAVSGAITIAIACALGAVVGLIDTGIGVQDISVAQGILIGLAAAGVHTTVKQIG